MGLREYSWKYDEPRVWRLDAHNAKLYVNNPCDELRRSVLAVRQHFRVLAQGALIQDIYVRIDAQRINNEALAFLPLRFRTFSSSSYVSDVNLVLRGEEPRNGLAAMLTALEKAAIQRLKE